MLAYFYITRLSNDIEMAVQKNDFNRGSHFYKSLDPSRKNETFYENDAFK